MALKLADALRSSYATPTVVSEDAVDVLHEGFAIRLHINSTAGGADNEAAERHLIKVRWCRSTMFDTRVGAAWFQRLRLYVQR